MTRRRRARGLFERLQDPEHLEDAARLTARGKRLRADVAAFLFDAEDELARLRDGLAQGTWRPARFRLLYLRDPKPRVIAKAPFVDRIAHTAITRLCEGPILRSASEADFACRRGLGTHRTILALHRALCRHRFVVHLDVRSYFASIRPEVVRLQLERRIADERFLEVVDRVLRSGRGLYDSPRARAWARMDPDWPPPGRGLPMGAATSQLFAVHLHLQEFDHFVKRRLKAPAYVRYVDDLFVFGGRRAELRAWREEIGAWLEAKLDLRLKHPNARILSCGGHLDGLGARIRRGLIEPLPGAVRRLRARVGDHVQGRGRTCSAESLSRSVAATMGHFLFG